MNKNLFEQMFSHLIIISLFLVYIIRKNSEIEILLKRISELEEKSKLSEIVSKDPDGFFNNNYLVIGSVFVLILFLTFYFNSRSDGGNPDLDPILLNDSIANIVTQKKVSELRETFLSNHEAELTKIKVPSAEELNLFLDIFSN